MRGVNQDVTQLLRAWSSGDEQALQKLTSLLYDQLHRAAQSYMSAERPNHTLQATALVNEAYLRLADCRDMQWQDRVHFLAVAARLMRRILVDSARARAYQKRGAGNVALSLDEAVTISSESDTDLLALEDALQALAAVDGRKSKIVELRFFGGLSIKEAAEFLKVSEETVVRDWRFSKSWILRYMNGENPHAA